jgi:ADP-ribose pyrophosphatase YjhB (NUDIX family)
MKNESAVFTELRHKQGEIIKDAKKLVESYPRVPITVDCVIFGFDENELKVLLIRSDLDMYRNKWSLLGDFAADNEILDDAAYRVLKERTGMEDVYLAQVKTFSRPNRHPGGRVLTVAYCSLLNIEHHQLKKMDNEFRLDAEGFNAGRGKSYRPEDLKIIKTYRFEGDSDPSDSSILYVIEAKDGLIGYSLDAYGVYSNHDEEEGYDNFIRAIPVENRDEQLLFEV